MFIIKEVMRYFSIFVSVHLNGFINFDAALVWMAIPLANIFACSHHDAYRIALKILHAE